MADYKTVEEFEQILGIQIRNLRLMLNIDQRELAAQAGLLLTLPSGLNQAKHQQLTP